MAGSRTLTRELLERWHGGDEEALNTLLVMELPWVREHVRRRLGPLLRRKGVTEDYVQEAMLRLLRYGPRFLISSRDHFRALLVRMVENVLRDEIDRLTSKKRAAAKERRLITSFILNLDAPRAGSGRATTVLERQERQAWVRLGLELLQPEDRDVLLLREFEGLSFPRIAESIGVSEDAARMRYNRALVRLAEKVRGLQRADLPGLLGEGS